MPFLRGVSASSKAISKQSTANSSSSSSSSSPSTSQSEKQWGEITSRKWKLDDITSIVIAYDRGVKILISAVPIHEVNRDIMINYTDCMELKCDELLAMKCGLMQ